jgi:hypothetical protein
MRMRKLGNGHSVMFCGPPEIDRKIMEIACAHGRRSIEVYDVLYWSMEETIANTKKLLPIWVKQGIGYQKRLKACDGIEQRFPEGLLEQESKSLEKHYGFAPAGDESIDYLRRHAEATGDLNIILEKCQEFEMTEFGGATMQEEQERELAHEVECERENEVPPKVDPVKPRLSDEVRQFIKSGRLRQTNQRPSTDIIPAFSVIERTSANTHWQRNAFSSKLLATSDFCDVIPTGRTDDFLRPVNWIVSSTVEPIMVVMSSYEVNLLLPEIHQSRCIHLHMYSPRVTLAAPSYESLAFCPIPPLPNDWQPDISLVDQLNIFAGQLYFRDYEAYKRVCAFLGLYLNEPSMEMRTAIHSDGFVDRSDRHILGMTPDSPFDKSPIPLLRELIGFRRKGQNSIASHMGQILHGRLLTEKDM